MSKSTGAIMVCIEDIQNKKLKHNYKELRKVLAKFFVSKRQGVMSRAKFTYPRRGLKQNCGKLSRFYTSIKVYKNPHQF